MKIVTWNIAGAHTVKSNKFLDYEKENLNYFIEHLQETRADIVLLQETHVSIDQSELNQSEIIAKNLGYQYVVDHVYGGKSHIKKGQQLALSIISKHKILDSQFFKLPNPKLKIKRPNGDIWISFDVGFLSIKVKDEKDTINISNTHLVPFHHFQRDFAELEFAEVRESISNFLRKLSNNPTIVGGDFNFSKLRELLPRVFDNNKFQEAFETDTTPVSGQQDHILFSNHFILKDFEIKKLKVDHFLCQATLDIF